MDIITLLYYRRPYQSERELVCACDSEEAAQDKIDRLMYIHPDAYPERSRFETSFTEYHKLEGVVNN